MQKLTSELRAHNNRPFSDSNTVLETRFPLSSRSSETASEIWLLHEGLFVTKISWSPTSGGVIIAPKIPKDFSKGFLLSSPNDSCHPRSCKAASRLPSRRSQGGNLQLAEIVKEIRDHQFEEVREDHPEAPRYSGKSQHRADRPERQSHRFEKIYLGISRV